eukprot:523584-Rhodomonas_salina.2
MQRQCQCQELSSGLEAGVSKSVVPHSALPDQARDWENECTRPMRLRRKSTHCLPRTQALGGLTCKLSTIVGFGCEKTSMSCSSITDPPPPALPDKRIDEHSDVSTVCCMHGACAVAAFLKQGGSRNKRVVLLTSSLQACTAVLFQGRAKLHPKKECAKRRPERGTTCVEIGGG